VLLVESTYGNRLHRLLGETIDELVFVVRQRQGKQPRLQMLVDSPMANKVTEITWQHKEFLDDESRALDLRFNRSVEDSMGLNRRRASRGRNPAHRAGVAIAGETRRARSPRCLTVVKHPCLVAK
jgi:hypothetical protein